MKISYIYRFPVESLDYLERYVNDGSPSGFTDLNRSKNQTDPYCFTYSFDIYILKDEVSNFIYYGDNNGYDIINNSHIFIHPDMINHIDLTGYEITKSYKVIPTASCRTVRIIKGARNGYIKLHYDGFLGRVKRPMNWKRAINGPEISKIILNGIEKDILPHNLSILHEPFGKFHKNKRIDKDDYWGFIYREQNPRGKLVNEIKFKVPLFSLWSNDRKHPNTPCLFSQLSKIWKNESNYIIIELILKPIIDIYFKLLLYLGLQNELNAQNILLGFDKDYLPVSVILRDMMGIQKDITLREKLGLLNNFDNMS